MSPLLPRQIATYLTPLDLQHLSWTCKSLHIILSSKVSQWSWRASVRMVDGLPECPKDISYPRYTALVFGRNCFVSSFAYVAPLGF